MENLTGVVLPIIRKTRDITLPHFGKAELLDKKSNDVHDVVTKLDQEVETYLKEELKKVYPDIPFVGEEFGGDHEAKRFWLVDPIDGTAVFMRGIPFCTTMLALIDDGQVVFSVIYDFVNDVVYHAEKGKGAYKNEKRIHVSEKEVEDSFLCWETHIDKTENLNIMVKLREISALCKFMCSGYEYALIAEGKMEGRVAFDPYGKDHDFAPGSLLVAEAGGIVTNLNSKNYDYRNLDFIACNLPMYKKLTDGVDALFPVHDIKN